jgi:lauroyl/myristoyl acyltransferase
MIGATKAALLSLSWCLRALPYRWAMGLGAALGSFVFHVLGFRRRIVLDNLTIAFGASLSQSEIRRLAWRNYRHYGRLLVDFLLSLTWSADEYRRPGERPSRAWSTRGRFSIRGRGSFSSACIWAAGSS